MNCNCHPKIHEYLNGACPMHAGRSIAPTDNGIEKLDSICKKYNDGEITLSQLVCTVWNTAIVECPHTGEDR